MALVSAKKGPSMSDDIGVRAVVPPACWPSWAHPLRWLRIAVFAALAAGITWAISLAAPLRIESEDDEIDSRCQGALPGIRKDPQAAINVQVMSMGWVANLDGTAVAYTAEADGLIGADGRFRTDLSPDKTADILHLDPAAITRKGSPREIDPGAVLFRAQAGTLTDRVKAMSRQVRRRQAAEGRIPDAAYGEWDVRDFAFTLDGLRHPDEEEKTVLAAIVRSKLLVSPRPGDAIRATPVDRGELESGRVALRPGMLPPCRP
jgi:hypothetical protein